MCTYIVHHNRSSATPLIIASTRDENPARGSHPPMKWDSTQHFQHPHLRLNYLRSFQDDPYEAYTDAGIIAPHDELSSGTYAGINRHGVVAAINNRMVRSHETHGFTRAGLVLDALIFKSAKEAAESLFVTIANQQRAMPPVYQTFNLIIADAEAAYVISNMRPLSRSPLQSHLPWELVQGTRAGDFIIRLSRLKERETAMVCNYDVNDQVASRRIQHHLPFFQNLDHLPKPSELQSFGPWLARMAHTPQGFGDPFHYSIAQPHPEDDNHMSKGNADYHTMSTSLFWLENGAQENQPSAAHWLFHHGPPEQGRMVFELWNASGKQKHLTTMLRGQTLESFVDPKLIDTPQRRFAS